MSDEDCEFHKAYASHYLHHLSSFGTALGVALCIGTALSMLPQHIKFLSNKSSVGVSYIMLFMGNVNQFAAVVNTIIMKFHELQACQEVPLSECTPSVLTFVQMLFLWAFYFPLYIWFLIYLDPAEREIRSHASRLLAVFLLFALVLSVVAATMLKEIGPCDETRTLAYGLGVMCTIITLVQWTPQIYHTYKAKRAGSLSLLMLYLQAPGSLIVVYFLAIESRESASLWFATLMSAIEQLILLGMLLYYQKTLPPVKEYLEEAVIGEEKQELLSYPPPDDKEVILSDAPSGDNGVIIPCPPSGDTQELLPQDEDLRAPELQPPTRPLTVSPRVSTATLSVLDQEA
eukprot:Rmarinus@m.14667